MAAPWPGILRLEWSPDFKVRSAEGDALALSGRETHTLTGVSLWDALRLPREKVEPLRAQGTFFLARLEDNRH